MPNHPPPPRAPSATGYGCAEIVPPRRPPSAPVAPKEPAADEAAKTTSRFKLQAGETAGVLYPFTPDTPQGAATLRVEGRSRNLPVEVVQHNIRVVPEGFSITQSRSDLLEHLELFAAETDLRLGHIISPRPLRLRIHDASE